VSIFLLLLKSFYVSLFSVILNLKLNKAIKQGAKLITNAVAYEIITDSDNKVTGINYKRPNKKIETKPIRLQKKICPKGVC
jgi:hypothetical protein